MKKYIILIFILICICMYICSGCMKESEKSQISEPADTIEYTDALGRKIQIQKNPQRVAALLASYADLWMLSGGEVCATVDDAWEDLALDLGEDTVNLGATKSPNLEALMASDPDLILASASTAADVEMLEVLEQTGLSVVYLEVNCFQEYMDALKLLTEITGCSEKYEQYGIKLQEEIEGLVADYKETQKGRQPEVLFLRASSGYIRAKNSSGSILGEMLKELECRNIADADASLLENLSIESIIEQDPEHIFIVQSGDDAEGTLENVNRMMEENPAWKELTAVKEGRVHYMDKHLFNLKPNGRWAEAYEQLIGILQGETETP